MKKIKLNEKDESLISEAIRRIAQFKHKIDSEFLGLGYPSEYKSDYFTVSFPPEIKRVNNWYKLTEKGKQVISNKLCLSI